MAKKKIEQPFVELGGGGPKRYGGNIVEEFLPDLQGSRAIKVYNEMRRNEPLIGAILFAYDTMIHSVDWMVKSASDDPKDLEWAAWLETCMSDMSHTWRDFLDDVMSCLPFGWSAFEIVYKLRRKGGSKYDDGKVGWKKISLRAQEGLTEWIFDEHGGTQGMVHNAPPNYVPITIPVSKMVLFKIRHERGSPEGYSLLRNVYKPWYHKKNTEWIESIGVERDLVGVPVIQPSQGTPWGASSEERLAAQDLGERLRNDEQAYVALPPPSGPGEEMRWHLTLLGSPGAKQYDTNEIINRYSNEIAVSLLTGFLRIGLQGGAGANNIVRELKDVFLLAVEGILNTIEDIINRFMVEPLLVQMNNYSGPLPKIVHGSVGRVDTGAIANAIAQLVMAGVLVPDERTETFLSGLLGLPDKKATVVKASENVAWESDEPLSMAEERRSPLQLLWSKIDASVAKTAENAQRFKDEDMTEDEFFGEFEQDMEAAYLAALFLAQKRLTPDTDVINPTNRMLSWDYRAKQEPYLSGLKQDAEDLSPAQLAARSALYLTAAQGLYHQIVAGGMSGKTATWHLSEPAEHCPDCVGLSGRSWPAEGMSQFPGDGNTKCLSNCKCYLTYG